MKQCAQISSEPEALAGALVPAASARLAMEKLRKQLPADDQPLMLSLAAHG